MSIDLSLERLKRLVSHLPPYCRPTLHVAGTNGKGSVSALLASILLSSEPPLRVGRYNSPHLVSIYDCITLDGIPVSETSYRAVRKEVEDADKKHGTNLSGFELLTLTALQVFEKERVDIVVLEVGLGGRLDATNIVPDECIVVSALTAVDLDHQAYLGATVRLIAKEKAGIARKGRPFVLGTQFHKEVEEEAGEITFSVGSTLVRSLEVHKREWDETLDGPRPPPFSLAYADATKAGFSNPPPQPISANLPCFPDPIHALLTLYGAHQLDNLSTALTIINELLNVSPPPTLSPSLNLTQCITPNSIADGIKNVQWPGRLSFHPIYVTIASTPTAGDMPTLPASMKQKKHPLIVLADGAHNPASAKTLGAYIIHLLELALGPSSSESSAVPLSTPKKINVDITYILSLSHSPPKTPLQTLSPILPAKLPSSLNENANFDVTVSTSVALLRFSPPEGMPWVNPVPPAELATTVRSFVKDAEIWVASDGDSASALGDALRWAAERQDRTSRELDSGTLGLGLVVLAGSLYLVADFYRLLESDRKDGSVSVAGAGAGGN